MFFRKYLPWNVTSYLIDQIEIALDYYESEKRRYEDWLRENDFHPLRARRRDAQIITTGVDFATNSPKLKLLRIKTRNPYKNQPIMAVPPE